MALSPEAAASAQHATLRPIGAYALSGLTATQGSLWAVDRIRGYLLEIDPATEQAQIRNALQVEQWLDGIGLAVQG